MKIIFLLSISLVITISLNAQITITPQQTAQSLVNKLVATSGTAGVATTNATLNCFGSANAEFTGVSNLGISDGILLGNGLVDEFLGLPNELSSNVLNFGGDSLLSAIVGTNTFDACVLEFDLQPVGNTIQFEYVFGSDEYPFYNCAPFNDIFAFHISGPGINGMQNIALVPGTTTPVSINSINDQSTSGCGDSTYYVNNMDTFLAINGFTTPLIASSPVTPNATYHLRLAIADVTDAILNSYVVLKANSLKSSGTPTSINEIAKSNGISLYPTAIDNQLNIKNKSGNDWHYIITNLTGNMVSKGSISKSQTQSNISFENFSKGIYFVKMIGVDNVIQFTQKVIKQ